jgi:hypothetical protein
MSLAFTIETSRGKVPIEIVCGTLQSLQGKACRVFSVVGDEPYFVPYFLDHYRNLGVTQFVFYLDRQSDELRRYIVDQPDVTAFTSSIAYATVFGKYSNGAFFRFHHLLNDVLTEKIFAKRWALSVDIDEFAILSSRFSTLDEYCSYLDGLSVVHVGAPMVETYPKMLSELDVCGSQVDPFSACKFFDIGPYYSWSDRLSPDCLHAGIRQRLFEKVQRLFPQEFEKIIAPGNLYRPPKMWKVPLLKHGYGVRRIMKHEATSSPSIPQGLALMHFKFFPGYQSKVADAIVSSQYYRNSLEYRLLNLAHDKLSDCSLIDDSYTQLYQGSESLVAAKLLSES